MVNNQNRRIPTTEIVDLLLPFVRTEGERTSLVTASWGPESKLQYKIDYEGPAEQFAIRFVADSLRFGKSLNHPNSEYVLFFTLI